MAGKFTKSWSFFGPRRPQSDDYLGQHYQPSSPNIRVNLQQRFGDKKDVNQREWRRGPLPPPPTQQPPSFSGLSQSLRDRLGEKPMPRFVSFDFNRLGGIQSHYVNVDECGPSTSGDAPRASTLPRQPLRDLPSGVAPIWSNLQENVSNLKPQTSKIFQEGGKKVNRALQGVRTSLSSFAQMFRSSTRRRYKLDGTPTRTPKRTPNRPLRPTPGKLYSPFNVNTPRTPYSHHRGPKRLQTATPRRIIGNENRALSRTPQRTARAPTDNCQWTQFQSPSRNFQSDVMSVREGMNDFQRVGNGIVSNASGRWSTRLR